MLANWIKGIMGSFERLSLILNCMEPHRRRDWSELQESLKRIRKEALKHQDGLRDLNYVFRLTVRCGASDKEKLHLQDNLRSRKRERIMDRSLRKCQA